MYAAVVSIGPPELLIVLVIVLVLFGGSKLPKLARSLGQAQKEFKEGVREAEEPVETRERADRANRADEAPSP